MKNSNRKKMDKLRAINLKIGFIIAIGFAIMAFSYTIDTPKFDNINYEIEDLPELEVVRTVHKSKKKEIPKPKVEMIKEIDNIEEVDTPDLLETDIKTELNVNITNGKNIDLNVNRKAAVLPEKYIPKLPPEEKEDEFVIFAERMPVFEGCNNNSMSEKEKRDCTNEKIIKFIQSKIHYPTIAKKNNIEGTVVIGFVIDEKGDVVNIKIRRDIGGNCGQEAIRVVNMMPKWTPGRQQGRKVKVMYNVPVKFDLK